MELNSLFIMPYALHCQNIVLESTNTSTELQLPLRGIQQYSEEQFMPLHFDLPISCLSIYAKLISHLSIYTKL